MSLFSIGDNILEGIKEVPFKSERKDIQKVTESSLKEVFGCEFIKSEVTDLPNRIFMQHTLT